jgi:hypothetical protein
MELHSVWLIINNILEEHATCHLRGEIGYVGETEHDIGKARY